MSLLAAKLKQSRVDLHLTQAEAAQGSGLEQRDVSRLETGKTKTPPVAYMQFLHNYGVDLNWLLDDKNENDASPNASLDASLIPPDKTFGTKKADSPPKLELPRGPQVLVVTTEPGGTENIALVSTRVAAGYAAGGFIEPEFMRQLPTFSLPDAAYRNGTFRAFQVTGDSMQSTLYEHDWVICRYVEHWATGIQDTFVYVIVTDEQPVIKRVLNRLTERGQLTLQSDNPAYPTQFLDGERVREVWRAVGRLSRQFTNPRYDLIQEVSRSRADIDELMQRLDTLEQRPGHQKGPKKPH